MPLLGAKILLQGPSGTGKTFAIKTLVGAGLEVFLVAMDNGVETIGKFPAATVEHIHWRYIPPLKPTWDVLKQTGKLINTLNNEQLQKLADPRRGEYCQILDVIDLCNNFVDSKGKEWGSVDSWDASRVLVFDGLTGLNMMCRTLAVGGKPVLTQPDWGVSMDYELKLIRMLCGIQAHFVLIAHVEREINEVSGGMKIMASALGRKNAPQLPGEFSDVILTKRAGPNYYWSTIDSDADLKTRNLPLSDKLEPTFVPLFDTWRNSSSVLG